MPEQRKVVEEPAKWQGGPKPEPEPAPPPPDIRARSHAQLNLAVRNAEGWCFVCGQMLELAGVVLSVVSSPAPPDGSLYLRQAALHPDCDALLSRTGTVAAAWEQLALAADEDGREFNPGNAARAARSLTHKVG